MILHTIKLSCWRNFLEEVSLGPFPEGLSVIYAPNGSGKSTLLEALCRGLLDSHNVGGQEIKAIQPWGRALSPAVTIEFSEKATAYRITKQFLASPRSELARKEGNAYRPFMEGRNADEHVRELLTKNPPVRGLSQPKNWGLAQVLWTSQGGLQLTELSGDLVADIRSSLGVQISDTSTGPVEKQIEELFLQFYSPTGRLKSGANAPELVRIQERLGQAKAKKQEAMALLLEYEDTSRKVEDIRARRTQTRLSAEELSGTIRQYRERAQAYQNLKSEYQQKTDAVNTAEAQYNQLKQQLSLVMSTTKDLKEAQGELKTLTEDTDIKHREVEVREKELARIKTALENTHSLKTEVEAAEKEAKAARRYCSLIAEVEKASRRIAKIEEAWRQYEEARKARASHVAPDKETLSAIRKAINQRSEAQTLIDASLISLEIIPEVDGSLEIVAGEQCGPMQLFAGNAIRVKGAPDVVAEVKGVARLRATGPTGDIEAHRTALEHAHKRIGELTMSFGTDALPKLEELAEKGAELDARVTQVKAEYEAYLEGELLDELKQDHATQAAACRNLQQEHPDWETVAPQVDALENHAADLKRQFDTTVAAVNAEREKSQTLLSEAKEQDSILQTKITETNRRISRLQEQLADLTKDGKTEVEREKEINILLMTWEAAKASKQARLVELDAYEDDPAAMLEQLEKQLSAADAAATKARDDEVAAETHLESLASKGPYSAVAAAEEEVIHLEEVAQREQLRVDAIKLLHETLDNCRKEAVSAVARPVEQGATKLLQRIAGRRIGSIQLGDVYTPSAVFPDGVEEEVTIDNLSGGEKEQLYLATRLALAEVLAKEERQLVVFDDVLTATDSARFARIMTLLEEAAQRLQMLILTCHPERYRGLTGAEFFDLEALVQGKAI